MLLLYRHNSSNAAGLGGGIHYGLVTLDMGRLKKIRCLTKN